MAAPLVDAFGRPAYYQASGTSIYEDTQEQALRLARPTLDRDFARLLPRAKYRAMLSDCRYIATAYPLVRGAIKQKSSYVGANGWTPNFTGSDQAYEDRIKPVLRKIMGRSTNRGETFAAAWDRVGEMLDIDGGVFMLHHLDTSGYPLTQFIEAHRVANRDFTSIEVKVGPYDGATIINGIIYSSDGREIAYNVLGATPDDDRQIPVGQMYHIADFSFFSENRPIASVGYSVLDWYDVKETRGYQKIHNKANSAIAIIEETPTGTNINANARPGDASQSPSQTSGGMRVETLEAGMIRYIRSGAGKLTAHANNNPGDNWRAFDQTIVNGAFYGMGWRAEMMDLSQLKGAGVRGFSDNINRVILARHNFLSRWAAIDFQWKWSALQARGDIPESPEWDQWSFPKPARFDTDRKYTSDADLAEVRAGRKAMSSLITQDGDDYEEVLTAQAKYVRKQLDLAEKYNIPVETLGILSQPGDKSAASPDSSGSESDPESSDLAASFENLKQEADTYGVAVRAGAISPQIHDEEYFRNKAKLPAMSKEVRQAWSKDENVRRPITLAPPLGSQSSPPPPPSPDSAEE